MSGFNPNDEQRRQLDIRAFRDEGGRKNANFSFTRHLTPDLSPNSVGGEGENFRVLLNIRATGFAGRSVQN
jgi:hypothetical protein